MTKFFSLLAIAVAVAAPQTLRADILTFGAQSPIGAPGNAANDQSFVDTTGVGVLALNFTDVDEGNTTPAVQDVTVNGVFFNEIGAVDSQATQTFTGNGVTVNISGAGNFRDDSNSLGAVDGTLMFNTDVFALLNSGYIEVDQVAFSGLTPGDQYLVQFFVHDTRNNNQNDVTSFQGTAAGSNLGTVAGDNTGTAMDGITRNGLNIGGFITGTFTATSGNQVISVTSALGDETVNAVQLRNLSAVPEPSSVFLLLGGMGALLARRRK